MPLKDVTKTILMVLGGLSLALIGLLSYLSFPTILKWQVEENLILSPSAEPYEYWRTIPVPIYARYYFFNITNAKAILKHKAKPILQEVGPYTFRETREKVNITWNENGTVSYFQVKRWFFEPELTVGSLDDVITTVNVPMVTAANEAIYVDDEFFYGAIEAVFKQAHSSVFVTETIGSLLFDGYEEEILSTVKSMGIDVPYDKFGWFYAKNNSHDGRYTIFTGETSFDKYGYVSRWNGQSVLSGRSYPCNLIDGTAGDMWPPFRIDRAEKLPLFVADICSNLQLSYLSEVEVNEIESYRFWLDETTFDNGHFNRHNACQCDDTCMPPGALDIKQCQHGAPALVSFPHFLYADPLYIQSVDGLKPDPELHKFLIDLEPKLGIPVNVDAKLQINVAIPKTEHIKHLRFAAETVYYPVFWFSESASINLETAEKLKFVTKSLPQYVTIGCFVFVVAGGVVLVLALHSSIQRRKKKPSQPIIYTAVRTAPTSKSV